MYNFIPVDQSVLQTVTIVGTIDASQLPIFIGSGPLHNRGAVPDPGPTAGNLRFLCEDGAFSIPAGSGSVASVGLSMPNIFSVTGSPVTVAGTLAASLVTQGNNVVFAGPTVGHSVPTFRTLDPTDIPSIDFSKITTGTVPINQGGTNATTALSARINLGAASSGINTDITALSGASVIASPSSLTIASAASNSISVLPGSGGIVHVIANNASNVMRIRGGVSTTNNTAMLIYGALAGQDLWSIGNAISTNDTSHAFEVYDVQNAIARLRIADSGAITAGASDLSLLSTATTQTRMFSIRSSDYLSTQTEMKFVYKDKTVPGNIFGSIPNANLGNVCYFNMANAMISTNTATPIILAVNNTEALRISSTGLVGIQNASPSEALDVSGNVKATLFIGSGAGITGLTSGQIPSLDASKITTGTFSSLLIPSLDASKITTGTFGTARIPSLDASIITSGSLTIGRGGTGAATSAAAINNLLPTQTGNTGKVLQTDGSNVSWSSSAGAGTVTSFSAGILSPLFTTAVANNTTTPSLTFTLSNAAGNSWFGNATSLSAAPTYNTSPIPTSLLPANIKYSVSALSMGSSTTVDWSLASAFTGTTSTNTILSFTNVTAGQSIVIRITSGGNFTLTWPSPVLWVNGTEPTMSTTIGKIDVYTIFYDGSNYMGSYIQNLS